MKKKIIPLIVLLGTIGAQAQTGIGTYLPHGTAELEVSSTDKGMLIPRLALTDEKDVNTVKGGEYPESLLVYHTGIPTLEAGFYFWANKKWNALVSNSTLYNYIKETAKDGNVTITNEGDQNFSFTWIDKNTDKKETVSLETLVKGMETVTTLTKSTDGKSAKLIYSSEDKKNPTTEINLTDLLENSTDFTNFLTTFVSKAAITETDTPIIPLTKKVGEDDVRTGVYRYKSEKSPEITINVVDDVANNFDTIVTNSEFKKVLNKYFTENPPAGGTVTYKLENNKHVFNYTDKDGKPVVLNMSEIVKEYETDTPITALTKKVGEDDVRTGVYTYKSEKSPEITINVVDDVANNFDTIVTNSEFKKVLNKYFTENPPAGGTVTYKLENNKHVFNYTDKDGKPVVLNMSEIVKDYETVTIVTKFDGTGTEVDNLTKPTDGFTYYKYDNETPESRYISVSEDVSNDFEKIINTGTNKTIIENIAKGVAGTGAIAELKLVTDPKKNVDEVKAGFTFKDGNAAANDVAFAESLTGVSSIKTEVIFDDTTTKGEAIVYNYKNEADKTDTINLTEDVAKTFKTIINTQGNKEIIKEIVTETAGTGAIAELKLVTDPKENVDEVKAGFTFKDGNAAANDVAFAETLTKITMEQFNMYIYMDPDPVTGDVIEVHVDTPRPGEEPNETYTANKFVYENEKGDKIDIKGSDLFKTTGGNSGGNNNLETLTSLRVEKSTDIDNPGKYLVYLDEKSQETYIPVKEIFDQDETITKLEVDLDKNSLIYTNETGVPNPISLNQIVNEPWYVAKTTTQATKNDQDIYTQGWVGIGYDTPSDLTKVPNEKLRVNGSITATNSYYADYVFESYFDGYSSLKYDYKFNDLNTVDNFIKTNRHLPGITPINELRKTETGYSFNISELSIQLLEKTEELFLHVIDQQKELNAKESRIEKLESEMTEMSDRLRALEALLTK